MYKLLAILLLSSGSVFAALPPLSQSSREIKAILDSQETYKLLGSAEPILQIAKTANGYLVVTTHKELLIDIQYVSSNKIGPAEFELFYHSPVETE